MRYIALLLLIGSIASAQEKSSITAAGLGVFGFGGGFKYVEREDYATIFYIAEVAELALMTNDEWRKSATVAFIATKLVEVVGTLEAMRRYKLSLSYSNGPRLNLQVSLN